MSLNTSTISKIRELTKIIYISKKPITEEEYTFYSKLLNILQKDNSLLKIRNHEKQNLY